MSHGLTPTPTTSTPTPTPTPTRTLTALVAALALVAGVVMMSGTPAASAHAVLTGSVPEDTAELTEAPTEVTLQFNEEVGEEFAMLVVRGPDGAEVDRTSGDPRVEGRELIGDVEIDEPGAYTAAYRVTSADGHVVQGSTSFTVLAGDDPGADTPGGGEGDGAGDGAGAGAADGEGANGADSETGTIDSDRVEPGEAADGALQDNIGFGAGIAILAVLAILLIGGALLLLSRGRRKREEDAAGNGADGGQ